MIDSLIPFFSESKKKKKTNFKFNKLNLIQFFYQRHGIGKRISNMIFSYSGYHRSIKYEDVKNKNYYVLLRYKEFFIRKKLFLDSFLLEEVRQKIKGYINLYNWKGRRHKLGMPVRGQRLKTNAKTASKLRYK